MKRFSIFASIVWLTVIPLATAEASSWKGGEGNWSSTNWYDGEPTASDSAVIWNGTATITDNGEICKSLQLAGGASNFHGHVVISSGSLEVVAAMNIGPVGYGTVNMTGGLLKANTIVLSLDRYNPSTIDISGNAEIQCKYLEVGWPGKGYLTQNGGTITTNELALTNYNDDMRGEGYYTLNGGTLNAGAVYVGIIKGEWKITNPGVNVYIHDGLDLRPGGTLSIPAGTFFHMNDHAIPPTRTGDFRINKTNPEGIEDLVNLTLSFDGTVPASSGEIEVAGKDLGDSPEGFQNNFVLGGLYLGPNARVSLVNLVDNQPEWNGAEALYVKHIRLAQGAVLDCSCYHVYYETIENVGGMINKGVDCDKIDIWADPEEIPSDGKSQSQIFAKLILNKLSAPGKVVTFTTDKGKFLDPQTQQPVTTVSLTTNAQGIAQVAFVASDDPGMAFIDVAYSPAALKDTCGVSMVEYNLHIVADQAWYLQVPGRDSNHPFIRSYADNEIPEATLFGRTDIPLVIELDGVNPSSKVLQLHSTAKRWVNENPFGVLQFPDEITTDGQGKAYVTLHVDKINEYNKNHYANDAYGDITEIDLTVIVKDDPSVTYEIQFPVIDNFALIVEQYEKGIPLGLIRRENEEKINNWLQYVCPTLANMERLGGDVYYGLATDLLSHIHPEYDVWTCGGYQIQVLYLLDTIRLESDFPWILNGFDYGPIKQLQGLHQAAVIWPADRTYLDTEFGRILDPWPAQDPHGAEYSSRFWLGLIGVSVPMGVGLTLELTTEPGSSDEYIDGLYPVRGPAWHYPPEPYWSFKSETPPHYTVLLDCPVDLVITDSLGRRLGNVPNWDPAGGQSPFITEIPGLGWYAMLLPDGTRAWLINLPAEKMDLQITGTEDGSFNLAVMDAAGRFRNYLDAPIGLGQTAQIRFDPTTETVPGVVFDDGHFVLSDNLLSFGMWNYLPTMQESSATLTLTNRTVLPIHAPLWLVSETVDPGTVSLIGADGITPGGRPYLDFSSSLSGGVLNPGQSLVLTLHFLNPDRIYFNWKALLQGLTPEGNSISSRNMFNQIGLKRCSRDGLLPFDLAEGNAADWETWAADMEPENTFVYDDTGTMVSGNSSVMCITDAPFDMYIRYGKTLTGPWDLSRAQKLFISFYARNDNDSFQNGSPWIRLKTDDDNYYQFQYFLNGNPYDFLNDCLWQWKAQSIALDASETEDNGWRRTTVGSPDFSQIRYLEIHADTWGAGFQLGVDGVGFDTDRAIYRDFNADCSVDTLDLDTLAQHWLCPDCTPVACEGADIDLSGKVDLADFALFAEAWLKE